MNLFAHGSASPHRGALAARDAVTADMSMARNINAAGMPAARFTVPLFFACLLLCACTAFLCVPAPAQAKSYDVDACAIDATLGTDGTLSVVETRSYTFSGDFSLVGRVLAAPNDGACQVSEVSVTGADGASTQLPRVDFDVQWRDEGGPASPAYAIDEEKSTIYTFSNFGDGKASVTWHYSYENALVRHSDVAELYWQFVGTREEVSLSDVDLSVHLPAPAGTQTVAGDNVRAWGHGALDASVFVGDASVSCTCPVVSAGEFAELRTTFPAEWAPDVAASCVKDGTALSSIVDEETKWADEANAQRASQTFLRNVVMVVCVGLPPVLLIISLVLFLRYGREYRPRFQDEYWRDVPAPGLAPAVVGHILNWNRENGADLTAQLVHLSATGAVALERTTETTGTIFHKEKDAVRVTRVKTADQLDGLDAKTVQTVFDKLVGADSFTSQSLAQAVKDDKEGAYDAMQYWHGAVCALVEDGGYLERRGRTLSVVCGCVSVPVFLLLLCATTVFELPLWMLGLSLACAVGTVAFAVNMKRRSREGAEIVAKARALKRWFKDFTNLKEAIPTDAKVWGELLAYATLFGVAQEVVEKLRVAVPELWQDDGFVYCSYWGLAMPAGALDTSFSRAIDLAATSPSSGTGAGGGFSGGGGGGFGGGGGGFAR